MGKMQASKGLVSGVKQRCVSNGKVRKSSLPARVTAGSILGTIREWLMDRLSFYWHRAARAVPYPGIKNAAPASLEKTVRPTGSGSNQHAWLALLSLPLVSPATLQQSAMIVDRPVQSVYICQTECFCELCRRFGDDIWTDSQRLGKVIHWHREYINLSGINVKKWLSGRWRPVSVLHLYI